MALSTAFQTKQNTRVIIGDEANMGTAASEDTAATIEMPVTDYSFDEIHKHSLSVAPPRTGSGAFTQSDDMVKWQRHDRMYDISITFHGTAQSINRVCKALFGDGDGTNTLIGSMPSITDFRDGQSNSVPVTLWFENAAHAGQGTDMYFTSCLCTGLTLSGDIASNGGVVMCTATFQTGYQPTQAAFTLESTSSSNISISDQTTMFNMHDLTVETLNEQDLLLYSFELAIARPVNRIGFDNGSNFKPMGYSVGGYEVTGSLTCKRDAESLEAIDADMATPQALALSAGDVYQIDAPKCIIDAASISMDDDGWKQTIPFRCTYSGAATSTIVSIKTA
tara:strand:- start:4869 stop:5876 length:1008 start_codon:yes stop_codon:yes gene_type:complete